MAHGHCQQVVRSLSNETEIGVEIVHGIRADDRHYASAAGFSYAFSPTFRFWTYIIP